jgi:hypothetical protein
MAEAASARFAKTPSLLRGILHALSEIKRLYQRAKGVVRTERAVQRQRGDVRAGVRSRVISSRGRHGLVDGCQSVATFETPDSHLGS